MTKRKSLEIQITPSQIVEFGKIKFAALGDELWHQSKKLGKRLKRDGYICISGIGKISNVFFNKKTEQIHIHARISLSDLRKLLKEAEKKAKYYKNWNKQRRKNKQIETHSSFIHLNPELSFIVDYSEVTKK